MEVTRIADRIARSAEPADEQFRLLVSSVTDYAIYLLDPAGRVASWNAGAERIKGYRAGEVIGRHYAMFYPLEERAAGRPEQNLAIALREGRCQGQGWRVRRDGARFWAEAADGAEVKADIKKFKAADQDVHLVDLKGTYIDRPAGPFAGGAAIDREGYRMLGAVIATKDAGQYFVKLYGPEKTITAAKPGFEKMLEGLKAK